MSAVYDAGDRPVEDLTARARIRDAALRQFAEQGVRGATMKGIADAAGVSTGLVQHHFGSKEALRQACDDAVIEVFRGQLVRSATEGTVGQPAFMAALQATSPPLLRYLARAMSDGSDAAAYVFDQLAAGAAEFLSATWPERFPAGSAKAGDAAAVMAAMHGGTIVLHQHLARQLGVDPLEPESSARIGTAMFDLYGSMGEFAESEIGADIKKAITAEDSRGAHE